MATLDPTRRGTDERTWASFRTAIDNTIAGRQRHADGTVFVPADVPDLAGVLRRYRAEQAPVVLVYEDGREEIVDAGGRTPPEIDKVLLGAALGLAAAYLIDKAFGR